MSFVVGDTPHHVRARPCRTLPELVSYAALFLDGSTFRSAIAFAIVHFPFAIVLSSPIVAVLLRKWHLYQYGARLLLDSAAAFDTDDAALVSFDDNNDFPRTTVPFPPVPYSTIPNAVAASVDIFLLASFVNGAGRHQSLQWYCNHKSSHLRSGPSPDRSSPKHRFGHDESCSSDDSHRAWRRWWITT